ncbi:MAG: lactonase family protein [Verrucomicrobia bacterium]|nr:lactonase family protein [Verrucomicrobiota bacterium]
MSVLVSALLLLGTNSHAFADPGLLFVSLAGDKKIVSYRQDSETGTLTKIAELAIEAEPGYLSANKNGTRLFAAYRSSGELASYQIDSTTGRLNLISKVNGGADPAYVALDRSETYLMSAYYRAGKVGIHRVDQSGRILDEEVNYYPTNQKAHAILTDPTNGWALVPHTGPNAVYVFSLSGENGRLLPSSPPLAYTGTLTGPRHLQFHPSLDKVYFDNEQGSSVSVFVFDSQIGQLSHLQTLPTLPVTYNKSNSCADLELTPDGRFLYASNRGHNSIAGYVVDQNTGKLTSLGQFKTEAIPRSFTISPSGKWLVVAGQETDHLQSYHIETSTGQLIPRQRIQTGSRPWAVISIAPTAQ